MTARRYYVDSDRAAPAIVAVTPVNPRYRDAHPRLQDAKEALLDIVRVRVGELREAARQARALRVRDFQPGAATEQQ